MQNVMGFRGKQNEVLIAELIRKQINGLVHVLRGLETEGAIDEVFFAHLNRVERQIHWLRTIALHVNSFLTSSHKRVNYLRKGKKERKKG